MRTLRYMFGGKPHNLDDCIDASTMEPPESVSLRLYTEEVISDFPSRDLSAEWTWEFPTMAVRFGRAYGNVTPGQDKKRQLSCVESANRRLGEDIGYLGELGITVSGSESRFNESSIYETNPRHLMHILAVGGNPNDT
ncbi:MAG: hypothetical protein ABIH90_02775 [Candidatus Aenigmatarchaeota archaeon]